MSEKLPFTKEAILTHLDKCIEYWRKESDSNSNGEKTSLSINEIRCYIDAYQSLRTSIFGELKS